MADLNPIKHTEAITVRPAIRDGAADQLSHLCYYKEAQNDEVLIYHYPFFAIFFSANILSFRERQHLFLCVNKRWGKKKMKSKHKISQPLLH